MHTRTNEAGAIFTNGQRHTDTETLRKRLELVQLGYIALYHRVPK